MAFSCFSSQNTFPLQLHLNAQRGSPSTQLYIPVKRSVPDLRFSVRPISASVSDRPPASVASPPSTSASRAASPDLPVLTIPGEYGLPFLGALQDRWDYFYKQGVSDFFKTRVQKYQSTVFRSNMPPGPFIASNPEVIVLVDGKSFPVLFDVSKVEKKDIFTGTYMPSTELTGGYRTLSYLDPSEPNHAKLKKLIFYLLQSCRDRVIPEFHSTFTELFETLESELASKGKASYNTPNDQASFNFLSRAFYGVNPVDTKIGKDGPTLIAKWVLVQLAPLLTLGLPAPLAPLEDLLLHTFRLPPFLVKSDYKRLYDFFYESSTLILDEAEKMGIKREEACHNLLFSTCFNSFGGMKILFPSIVKLIGRAGVTVHKRLAEEIRSAVKSHGGKVTMSAMEQMPLMNSAVYETFRLEPPVPLQYGKAKKDLVIESHDASFKVKAGEMLFGYQPFATKDPKIFEKAEEFVPERFMGEGEKLLKHVLWSNGPETENPTLENKQCAGKNFVVLMAWLLVVELFMRYDTFEIEAGTSALGDSITVTSVKKASF